MGIQNRAEQISDVKRRSSPEAATFASYALHLLKRQWEKSRHSADCQPDFYVIRTVTLLEVFTRWQIAALIDHGSQYTERAVELSKHFKMDFGLVRGIQGRAITLGDIVAHSIPLNSFEQILGYLGTLLGKPARPLLSSAVDRWAVEIKKAPAEPIIRDFSSLASRLTRLFEVRHILCHEWPRKPAYDREEIGDFLDTAHRFAKAVEEVLLLEKFGLVPLTQTEINIQAEKHLSKAEDEMNRLLSDIRSQVSGKENWRVSIDDVQQKWQCYRDAQCDFDTHLYLEGTIRPLFWSKEAERLTRLRIAELQSWLEARADEDGFRWVP